jgi:2-polyprenyl-3-methyl-5-hydroxy-6-metoxy-1,4-benzoquinol methylase
MELFNYSLKDILNIFNNNFHKLENNFIIKLYQSDIDKIGFKSLIDLVQIYKSKITKIETYNDIVSIYIRKLDKKDSFHKDIISSEKYGVNSNFFKIDKLNQTSFLYHYQKALNFINIKTKNSILNLGINRADEFLVIKDILTKDEFKNKNFVGIDYCESAIEYAKEKFYHDKNINFFCHDINNLDTLKLKPFDTIISIGTLQSSNLNFKLIFQEIIQKLLDKNGTIILGFPNCRWIEDEMIYGASVPHYGFSELSTVIKDIFFCKKYLQQKKFKVIITGKDYLFLAARKI